MTLQLHNPLDMHLHLRDNRILQVTAPLSARDFSGAIIMPNLLPPITTKDSLIEYRSRIKNAISDTPFTPYMTLFFNPSYRHKFLADIADNLTAIKLYPAGITTNSQEGLNGFNIDELSPTLEAMSELNIPLCIHGETNGFVMDREAEFVPIYEKLATAFPNLKIIMEHITTKQSVQALDRHPNLYATITLHHLLITLDDVAGGMLRPHLFCKPIAKTPDDREALLQVALSAHPKVMFGSDSAPHPQDAKESPGCAAGVFTAPVALPLLAQLFEQNNSLDNLQTFVSNNAQKIYDITPLEKTITLEKKPQIIPDKYGDIVPMYASTQIEWQVTSRS